MSTTWLLRLRSCWAQRATMNKPAAASLRAVQYRSSTKSQLDRARPHICWPRPCQRPPRMATALTASADEAERAMARMLGEEAAASGSSLFAGDDNIRVAARIRPMSAKEVAADPRQAIKQFGPRSVQCLVSSGRAECFWALHVKSRRGGNFCTPSRCLRRLLRRLRAPSTGSHSTACFRHSTRKRLSTSRSGRPLSTR